MGWAVSWPRSCSRKLWEHSPFKRHLSFPEKCPIKGCYVKHIHLHTQTIPIRPAAGAPGQDAVRALATTSDPAVETALLRMAVAGSCVHQSPEVLAPIAQRFDSAAPAVRTMAPLAYLRLSDCAKDDKGYADSRARALASIEARLADGKDTEILDRLVLLGEAGHPLVSALLARQKATSDQLGKLLVAYGAIGSAARAAVPALVALLRDKGKEAWRRPTLRALAHIGPSAGEAKQAALDVLSADTYLLEGVAEMLASAFIRLSPTEFDMLARPYRKRCARAGAIFMFNLDRDQDCATIATSLEYLAQLAHLTFRQSSWRDGQQSDE